MGVPVHLLGGGRQWTRADVEGAYGPACKRRPRSSAGPRRGLRGGGGGRRGRDRGRPDVRAGASTVKLVAAGRSLFPAPVHQPTRTYVVYLRDLLAYLDGGSAG